MYKIDRKREKEKERRHGYRERKTNRHIEAEREEL